MRVNQFQIWETDICIIFSYIHSRYTIGCKNCGDCYIRKAMTSKDQEWHNLSLSCVGFVFVCFIWVMFISVPSSIKSHSVHNTWWKELLIYATKLKVLYGFIYLCGESALVYQNFNNLHVGNILALWPCGKRPVSRPIRVTSAVFHSFTTSPGV